MCERLPLGCRPAAIFHAVGTPFEQLAALGSGDTNQPADSAASENNFAIL